MTEFQEQLRLQHEKTMQEELEKLLLSSTGPEAQVGLDHLLSLLRASCSLSKARPPPLPAQSLLLPL